MNLTLTAEQISDNYDKYLSLLKAVSPERHKKIETIFQDLGEETVAMTPASPKQYYHNAIAGGLIEHSLNVYKFSSQIYDLWSDGGARMDGYTKNELLFCALTHDLGKLGYPDNPYYIESTDEWRRNKLGERYSHNPYISFMKHSDRSLFIMQQYQVKLSEAEFISIMIHDGLYDDKNKPYYAPFTTSKILHTNLSYILHQADVMSYRIELEREITEDNLFDNPNQVKLSKPESTLDDLLNKLK